MIVTPVDAATIILLREAEGKETKGFEVLMALRSSKSTFVPSAYVFPGGKVEEEDCLPVMENFCNKNDLVRTQSALDGVSLRERALGIWVAAIRETFEEVGLLLACQKDGTLLPFDHGDVNQRLRSYRELVTNGELNFADLLQREALTLAFERLHYFSHWITPELSPLRYDTRFFVAEVPWNQKVFHDGNELTKHVWIKPVDALERHQEKKFHMVVPTIVTLEELSCFETIGDVIESTRGKNVKGITTLLVFKNDEVQEHTPDGRIFRDLISSA